jgi:hypothetical protein
MSHTTSQPSTDDRASLHTQLFANLAMQHASMALIYLGVAPHPETGETMFDLDGARHFIDTLEMLEARSKGNLSADEAAVLKHALTTTRMAFVQAMERGGPELVPGESKPAPPQAAVPASAPPAEPESAGGPSQTEEDERKKFVKKY